MVVDVTVLGCSGSYGSPAGGACSGYLVRAGETSIWMDCGNGTFANLQRHLPIEDLSAVVITHEHPDHCVDLFGLHVCLEYGEHRSGLPVYAPEGLERRLGSLVGSWGPTFDWHTVEDADQIAIGEVRARFSRTDHGPPTLAAELGHEGKRLVYTADTGPEWTVEAFAPGADLVLSEATFQSEQEGTFQHLSARQAGAAARAARARKLVLTHLWPTLDPLVSIEAAQEAFGASVTLAAVHQKLRV